MEEKKSGSRLRLNLFDALVLIAALAVGGFLAWKALKPAPQEVETPTASMVRYTVRFQKMLQGTGERVQAGDELTDTIKNYALGKVVDAQVVPNETLSLNREEGRYIITAIEGYEDVLVTIEAAATENDSALVLDGGYELRAGTTVYLRGPGYMASGPVLTIHREKEGQNG